MKNQKGITLIALVITIIVLLILAGVSIAMLTGENGILTRATEASEASIVGEINEAVTLGLNEILAKKLDPTNTPSSSNITGELSQANIEAAIKNNNANIKSGKIEIDVGELNGDHFPVSYNGKKTKYTWKIDKDTGAVTREDTSL